MSIDLVFQIVAAGLTNGFVYSLVGLGLVVIYRGSGVLNAAQGDLAVLGAFVVVLLMEKEGLPYWLSGALGAASGALIGAAIDILCVRPILRRYPAGANMLIVTVGLSFVMSSVMLVTIGKAPYFLPPIGGDYSVNISDVHIQRHALILIAAAVCVVCFLGAFYKHTHLGRSMKAASIDPDGATTIGIDVQLMRTATFALGGLIGAIAGILQTPLIGVSFQMGVAVTLKGFAAAILGGLVNPFGAVLGGVILGLAEAITVLVASSGYQNIVAMVLLIVIMMILPNGLFSGAVRKGG